MSQLKDSAQAEHYKEGKSVALMFHHMAEGCEDGASWGLGLSFT